MKLLIVPVAIALSFVLASTEAQGQQTVPRNVITTAAASIYLEPDAKRTPLRVAKQGSVLRLLDVVGDWYHVEFNDPDVGRRVGYVERKNARPFEPEMQPEDLSVRDDHVEAAGRTASSRPTPDAKAANATNPAPTSTISLRNIHKIYIDKMPNDLDQYIGAEISKQMNGRLIVVLDKADADVVMRGVSSERTGTGAAITGRYLGLHDNATGSISLVDKDEKVVLWSGEAGDRSIWFGAAKRGGQRKVADRLVHDLKKAIEAAR